MGLISGFKFLMKTNKFVSAYTFNNAKLKHEAKQLFWSLSEEDRINVIASAHQALMTRKPMAAMQLLADYKEELVKPIYDEYRGGSVDEIRLES